MSDLIDRWAAIKNCQYRLYESALNNIGYECKADDVFSDIAQSRIQTWLEEVPAAQPERKTGRWIVYPAPDEQHCGLVKCPYCQEELIAEPTEYHYCPHCGVKMEVEHDNA